MPTTLVTVPEALAYLEEPDDSNGELQRAIARVSAEIIDLTGDRFTSAERVEFLDGDGEELLLEFGPVDDEEDFVLTDRVSGEVVPATDYEVDADAGMVRRASDGVPDGADWDAGKRRWKAEYTGGYDGVPQPVRDAALALLADRWTNRNANQTNESRGGVSRTRMDGWPLTVRQMLEPYILEEGQTG